LAVQYLKNGFNNVSALLGGYNAWKEDGFPVAENTTEGTAAN
jgi:rhodanese-related sulfurtransferase